MGYVMGTLYTRGNYKVPQYHMAIPHYDDSADKRYATHGSIVMHSLVHGARHITAGCEADGCEDDGDTARCFNAQGFVTCHHQPSAEVIGENGQVTTVKCPSLFCMVESVTPEY